MHRRHAGRAARRSRAPIVLSGAHPKTTVLDLVGAEHFPDEVVEDMRRYRSRGGSVKVNWILSEPPRFARRARCCTRAWRSARRSTTSSAPGRTRRCGKPAEGPYIEVEVPTAIDPSLTDDGTTVMTMFTQYGPHDEAGWPDGAREAYAQRCLDIDRRSTRRTSRDAVIHYEVLAPPDLERIFGLVGGSIFQGEQGLDQMAFMRPSPLLSRYATPVDGLYLCGAGTHPGGGVIAAAGHNAAQRVLKDRKRRFLNARSRRSAGLDRPYTNGQDRGVLNEPSGLSRRGLLAGAGALLAGAGLAGCENTTTPVATAEGSSGKGIMGDPTAGGPVDAAGHPARAPRLPGDAAEGRRPGEGRQAREAAASCRSTTTPTT